MHRNDRIAQTLIGLHHLFEHIGAAGFALHQVVGQQHRKGFAIGQVFGTQHRMAQAQSTGLTHIGAVHVSRCQRAHQLEHGGFAVGFELAFQLVSGVKVVFNRPFVAARYKHHVPNARLISLFHRVLNQRLVHNGQHFFRVGLGGRQKAGA